MFEANVLSAQLVTAALLPLLRAGIDDGGHADTLYVTSTAAQTAYPGGAGYNAAKAGEAMLVHALRLELNGEPIRVTEVAPGMGLHRGFTLNRLGGDRSHGPRRSTRASSTRSPRTMSRMSSRTPSTRPATSTSTW
ncbi:hypothetical protein GCM10023065_30200 [Microbacterium laevaniformans]